MTDKNYTVEDWQRWRDNLPRKALFTKMAGNLGQCKLCGNKYPLSARNFIEVPAAGPVALYGFIREGLMYVCRVCAEDWGPDFKDDVNLLYQRALANEASGQLKPLKPLSRGKP